jgi:hypothetical protein
MLYERLVLLALSEAALEGEKRQGKSAAKSAK